MQFGCIQRLAVALLLLCFAVLLPTHAHGAHAADAGWHAAGDGDAHAAEHALGDCPVCRLAGQTLPQPLELLPLIHQPAPTFALPVDDERPAMSRIAIPFHGRAPPMA